jgi:nitroimidazol reductase NimA-like FMN-containing flavoprotein (pyridoxamine 5'-phosphate oxidase superfamily)
VEGPNEEGVVLQELSQAQVEEMLGSETVGRITCERGGRTYVVPVTYEYRMSELLVRSPSGVCLHLEGPDRHVRFEVDRLQGFSRWQTVVGWGTCETVAMPGESHDENGPEARPTSYRMRLTNLRGFLSRGVSAS